jgi:hypothetical protein
LKAINVSLDKYQQEIFAFRKALGTAEIGTIAKKRAT